MSASRWTPDLLASLRTEMDPVADRAVAAFYEGGNVAEVNRLLSTLIAGTERPAHELPPALGEYLDATRVLPAWRDPAKIARGQDVFGEYGVSSCAILACASLPECYLMRHGIHVLAMTQRLEQHAQRRVLETAQMIMAVMFPGGLDENGIGVRTAQKVRLMHAAMRWLILHPPAPASGGTATAPGRQAPASLADLMQQQSWNEAWGKPINQEDLLFTLMTFAHVGIRSLNRLGAQLSPAEQDAYIHCWNVVGFIMGIREDLLPVNHIEAAELFTAIKADQGGSTPEARAMEASLLAFMAGLMPRGPLQRLPAYMTRYLIGHETADALGVPARLARDRVVLAVIVWLWRRIDRALATRYQRSSHLQFASTWIHDLLMAEIGKLPAAWNKPLFGLPSQLRASLPPDWDHPPAKAPSALASRLLSRL